MPPTLNIEEYQFRDDGIVLNGNDAALPFVDITSVAGLDGGELRTQTRDHEGTDGGFVDSYYEQFKTVVLEGEVYADPATFETFMETLGANFAPSRTSLPFYIMTDAGLRVVYGKSQGLKYVKTNTRSYGRQVFNVTLLCEDPRVYKANNLLAEISVGGVVGGRGYNKGYPFGYGPPVAPNSGTLNLVGSRDVGGLYKLQGPIVNPAIVNDRLGLRWDFTIALSSTDFLMIDPRLKTVRINNGPSRRSSMRGRWWLLQPGTNDFRLEGSGAVAGQTKLTITAQAARR